MKVPSKWVRFQLRNIAPVLASSPNRSCFFHSYDIYLGKYLTIPRTEGISTTDIVGRMLLMTCSHHEKLPAKAQGVVTDLEYGGSSAHKLVGSLGQNYSSATDTEDSDNELFRQINNRPKSNFLTTSHKLRCFGADVKPPTENQRVIYIAGAWDM
jgi:ethanolamine-phosphate cytidylyltransferase